MHCRECWAQNPDSAIFCGHCSHRLPQFPPTSEVCQGNTGSVSNGLKYGVLGASLFIPLVGLVMGALYLAKGGSQQKKATGKLWLFTSAVISFLYLVSTGGF